MGVLAVDGITWNVVVGIAEPITDALISFDEREVDVPTISMFYGVIVSMYFMDNRRHHLAHIHVRYQSDEAVVAIDDGRILEGSLPPGKMRLVQAWIEIHRDEPLADGQLAVSGQQPFKIEPLR